VSTRYLEAECAGKINRGVALLAKLDFIYKTEDEIVGERMNNKAINKSGPVNS